MNLTSFALLTLAALTLAACDKPNKPSERNPPGARPDASVGGSSGTDTTGIGVGDGKNSPNVPHTDKNQNNPNLPNVVTGETKK